MSEVHALSFVLVWVNFIFCERVLYIGYSQAGKQIWMIVSHILSKLEATYSAHKTFIVKRKENNLNNIWCICINILIDEQNYFQWEEHQRNEGKAEKMLWMDLMYFLQRLLIIWLEFLYII